MANVFAQFQGEIEQPDGIDTIEIHLTQDNFPIGGDRATLGFLVCPAGDSDLIPRAVDIDSVMGGRDRDDDDDRHRNNDDDDEDDGNDGDRVPIAFRRTQLPDGSSLVLAELERGDYLVDVAGRHDTTGAWQLHVFLVGDLNGDFRVTQRDISLINKVRKGKAGAELLPLADANKDGKITNFDVDVAKDNRGITTNVRILTLTAGLDPASDTGVPDDNLVNQSVVSISGVTLPGADVRLDMDGDGFDDGQATAASNGMTNFDLDAQLAAGNNTLRVRAQDSFGQEVISEFVVTLDNVAPTVASTSPADGATVEPSTGATLPVEIVFSEPMIASTVLAALGVSGDESSAITPQSPTYDAATNTLRFDLDASLPDGTITVALANTATDVAGNGLAGGPFTFTFEIDGGNAVTGIADISPATGEELVSLTRETVVTFGGPIDPTTIDDESLFLIAKGARVPAEIRVSPTNLFATVFYDSPLPESTEVRVVVDGDRITSANGSPLDADGDGLAGGVLTADFRTLPLTLIPGTRVFGYVYDSYNKNPDGSDVPVVGATISLDARPDIQAVTDATGFFELGLQDLDGDAIADGLPAPEFFVHIDGGTAINAPAGAAYATMGKPFHSVPGQRVQLSMPSGPFHIYLPPMAMDDIVGLPADQPADVGFGPSVTDPNRLAELFPDLTLEQRALLSLTSVTYPAGSAQDENGTPATLATVIPVNPDRLPAPLPPTASPSLVISVQAGTTDAMGNPQFNLAGGSTNFAVPAPVTFPNLDGLLPGEKSLIWSFDHDAGKWIVIGTGTVSDDGTRIVSDAGVGILAPGWHFTQVGTVTEGEPCIENQVCVQVNGGLLGDVIEVDLSGTGGREFQLHSNSVVGRIAEIDNWQQVLSETGKFYFIPNFPDTEARFSQAPISAEYTFSGIGRLATDPPDAPERQLFFTVQIKDIRPGYSGTGTNSLKAESGKLNTYRIEQRLKWLGFRGEKSGQFADSPVVEVNGDLSATVYSGC
jgi:hypothetical protein